MAVGRISGPLLKSNLIRNGIDLAFETDLLYLDVNNQRIGVRNSNPQHELDVNGTTQSNALEVVTKADIGDITIQGDTITSSAPYLNLSTLDSVVSLSKLEIDSIRLEGNRIEIQDSNADLEFRANGTGSVAVYSDLDIDGNLFVSGNITAEGNITIGDEDTDNVTFNAEVASDIIPVETDTYNLGSDPTTGGKEWSDIYTNNLVASTINSAGLDVDGIDLTLRQGNIYYVAENGDDTNSGDHIQDPYSSIKQALTVAEAGDTVFVFPGEYEEQFPLEIPQGVTVKGHSLRSVTIIPTAATNTNDCFLLNGETTVEDLTVQNFLYNAADDTGYAFRYASGFTVLSRSPYIKNITVITKGSVTSQEDPRGYDKGDAGKGVLLDGSAATANSKEASGLFHTVTFITPGVDAVTLTNGVRAEWLSCFTYFAKRSIYAVDGSSGLKGNGETALRIANIQGSVSEGDAIEYYDIDGATLLESAIIQRIDLDGKIYVAGKQLGFEEADERLGKTLTANGDAQLDTSIIKHGASSLLLDGNGDYVSLNSSDDFGFGTDDFTVEGWFYPTVTSGVRRLLDFRAGQINDNAVSINIDGLTPEVYVEGAYQITGNADLSLNEWNHVAYTRSGSIGTLYLNGTDIGSWTDNTDYGTSKPLVIGALFDGSQSFFQGNVDDVRIVNGEAITPPSGGPQFELITTEQTVLMARFDGEDGTQTFKDDVILSQDIRFSSGATATEFTLVDFTDFGAEVRIISSASVYGNQGIVGNGAGVIIYAIGHNVAYIGSGKESSNDPEAVIQTNEFIELNRAKVRFSSVDHEGDFRVGDLFAINQETGDITFQSANFSVDSTQAFTFSDGIDSTTIDATKVETGNIRISGNTVESLSGAINLDAFSKEINLENSVNITGDLDVTGDVTIGGNITIGDKNSDTIEFVADIDSDIIPSQDSTYSLGTITERWQNSYVNTILVSDIEISDNYIQTTESNADLELRTSGTGSVFFQEFEVSDNTISTPNDFVLQSGSEVFVLDSTGSIRIPVGSTSDRPETPLAGQIRFNTSLNRFEGFNGTDWIQLNGVVDIDGDTSVTAELTPGANDSIIRFTTDGYISTLIDQTGITSDKIIIDDIQINGNVISTITSNTDLELTAQGSGSVVIDDLAIKENKITNTVQDGITVFENTDNGYVKFEGTSGLVIPVGTNLTRPPENFTEIGLTRFNTDDGRVEIYDGSDWISVAGSEENISPGDAEDIAFSTVIQFG